MTSGPWLTARPQPSRLVFSKQWAMGHQQAMGHEQAVGHGRAMGHCLLPMAHCLQKTALSLFYPLFVQILILSIVYQSPINIQTLSNVLQSQILSIVYPNTDFIQCLSRSIKCPNIVQVFCQVWVNDPVINLIFVQVFSLSIVCRWSGSIVHTKLIQNFSKLYPTRGIVINNG